MKFSIIIPVYCVEQYLPDCINSVIDNGYQDIEVILVDDGSPDLSPQICDGYCKKDNRIKVIHKENGGLSSARNRGLELASGDYVIFLDSDDVIRPGALCELAEALVEHPDVLITEIYNTKDVKQTEDISLFNVPKYMDKEDVISFVFTNKPHTWPAVQYIIKNEFLNDLKLHFINGVYHEDVCWTASLFSVAKRFAFYNKIWYVRRVGREGSITNVVKPKRTVDMISIVSNEIRSNNYNDISEKERDIIFNQMVRAVFSSLIHYMEYGLKDRKIICRLIKDNFEILYYAKALHHKIFVLFMRIFGIDFTLRTYCKFWRR